jgi:prolyl-tRNA synthetase
LPLERVATPGIKTIAGLAEFLGVPEAKTAKAVFQIATIREGAEDKEVFVFAIVRGDMDLNETKLSNAIKATALRPATEAEIRAVGAEPGYASPIGLKDVLVVADDLIPDSTNLVAGSNEEGYHLRHVNYGRDYEADLVADIVSAEEGYLCPDCAEPMTARRGVEVGNIFKLGTDFSKPMGCTYQDQDGSTKFVVMGSYGIGSGRLLASIAEECQDEYGLIWPISVSPYQVHIVALRGGEEKADELYNALKRAGFEVLFDDREESPGVKFNDADLIGVPIRLTVSGRSLDKGGVELKLRANTDREVVPLEQLETRLREEIQRLEEAIRARLVEVPYQEKI